MADNAKWLAKLKVGDQVSMGCRDDDIETFAEIASTGQGLICLESGRRFRHADGHEVSSRWNRHYILAKTTE